MSLSGSTQRQRQRTNANANTNTSQTHAQRSDTTSTKRAIKAHSKIINHSNLRPDYSKKKWPSFPVSTIGILYLAGSCCALFGMGIFSSLRSKSKQVSGLHKSATTITTTATGKNCLLSTTTSASESSQTNSNMDRTDLERRLKGALWGFFAGDALASPTHWFYGGRRQVVAEYGHAIEDYTKPNEHLGGSILNKSDPNGGGRSKFGSSSSKKQKQVSIIGDVINHGKLPYWAPNQSYHYHATLQKGETTLEASLARVLMKSIVATGGTFDASHFRAAYVEFLQTPGSHNDTYASTCHRMFFANLIFGKLPPEDCPDNDAHNVDTMDGLVLPTIVALAGVGKGNSNGNSNDSSSSTKTAAASAACAGVTRKSGVLEEFAGQWSRVVLGAFGDDACFNDALEGFAKETIRRAPNPRVNEASTMSACYLGSSLPGLIDMVAKYSHAPNESRNSGGNSGERVWEALLANANVGGENVHRGSVMGAVLGARSSDVPLPKLVDGLYATEELEREIEAFVRAVLPMPTKETTASTATS